MAPPAETAVNIKDAAVEDEVDFSKIDIEEALKILQVNPHGLTSAEAARRLEEHGPNKLPDKSRNPFLVYLGYLWNPLSWAMEVAAIISIALLDYADFALIVALLLTNATISYVEEANADKAIKALAAALAPRAKAVRDGQVKTIDAADLVPGDVIIVRLGDVVPADIKVLPEEGGGAGDEVPLQVDQAALTGESLPVKKFTGDVAFSGSSIKQGERHAVVYATGQKTFFGRAAALIQGTNNVAKIQKVMNRIGAICLITIGVWVIIELCVQFGHYHHSCTGGEGGCPTLTNMLVIVVGGIPIAMPTVLSVTLALGAARLAKEGAIVAKMSAVEEMASMDILCSDKTGTLTLNKLSIDPQQVYVITERFPITECMKYAALSANIATEEPIDVALFNSYPDAKVLKERYRTTKFIPFNPVDKFTCATVLDTQTNQSIRLLKGSPQVVLARAYNKAQIGDTVNGKMQEFAGRGFRSLGLAIAEGASENVNDAKWEMLCLLPMFDPPRHDTRDTIHHCRDQGIEVKMITGDHLLIAKETMRMLSMGTDVYPSEDLIKAKHGHPEALHGYKDVAELCQKCNGFAEVYPEHKYEIVATLQSLGHICGMTGDGVNDAPALKKADVGIAVAGATDAARGAADIVLTEPGLSTIVTAIINARKIFLRMTTYAKYTVSMTFRICFTFGLLTVIYNWYFPTLLIVILAVFNDLAMIALAKDRAVPSRLPNSWDLSSIFIMGIAYGLYLTLSSWVLYFLAVKTTFFEDHCGLFSLNDRSYHLEEWCYGKIARDYPGIPPAASICAISTYAAQEQSYGTCAGYDAGLNSVAANALPAPFYGTPSVLEQCVAEQYYIRSSMTRALMYLQVSISGQALVFVVRHQGWSLIQRAGVMTYLAFLLAQIGATIIALFGFNGYEHPKDGYHDCQFCRLSTGGPVPFFHNHEVPRAGSESVFIPSIIGCTGYVIVAWIWSALWYLLLDPLKWIMCWILNEDGFRDQLAWRLSKRNRTHLHRKSKEQEPPEVLGHPGTSPVSYANPLGRASMSMPVAGVLNRASASVVPVARDSTGAVRVSADVAAYQALARRSRISTGSVSSPNNVEITPLTPQIAPNPFPVAGAPAGPGPNNV